MHLPPPILSPYRFQSVSLSGDLSNKGLPLSPYSVPLFPPACHPGCLPSCLAWDPFSWLSLAFFSLAPLSPLPCPPRKPPFPPCLEPPLTVPLPSPPAPSSPLPWHRETEPAGTGRRLTPGQPDAGQQQAERRRGRARARGPHRGARKLRSRSARPARVPRLQRQGHTSARRLGSLSGPRASAPPPRRLAPPSCPAPPVAAPPQRRPDSDQWAPSTLGEQGGSQCTPQHPLLLKDPHLRNLGL